MVYEYSTRIEGVSGSAIREIFKLLDKPGIISFAGGMPSPESFPGTELAQISEKLLNEKGEKILQYGATEGWAPLRESVCEVMGWRGIKAGPDNVLPLSGSSQGIELFSKVFLNKGDLVLCEAPTFLGALQTFFSYQACAASVPTDEDGLIPEALEEAIVKLKPKCLYTIPTFQNPTGKTISLERRKRIVEITARHNLIVIEDDPYYDLRYYGEAINSMKTYDEIGNIVHLMTFSKTISPGLRVGAAIADPQVIRKMTVMKQGADVHTSNLSQAIVDHYIRSGRLKEHIQEIIPAYREQLNAMLEMFSAFPEGTVYTKPQGGLFIWAELPGMINTIDLLPEACERGVAFIPGTHFYPDGGHSRTMRLNFSASSPEKIRKGMKILGDLICEKLGRK